MSAVRQEKFPQTNSIQIFTIAKKNACCPTSGQPSQRKSRAKSQVEKKKKLTKNITAFLDELSFVTEPSFIMELPFVVQLPFIIVSFL